MYPLQINALEDDSFPFEIVPLFGGTFVNHSGGLKWSQKKCDQSFFIHVPWRFHPWKARITILTTRMEGFYISHRRSIPAYCAPQKIHGWNAHFFKPFFKPTNQTTGQLQDLQRFRSVKLLKFEASRTNQKNLSELSERSEKKHWSYTIYASSQIFSTNLQKKLRTSAPCFRSHPAPSLPPGWSFLRFGDLFDQKTTASSWHLEKKTHPFVGQNEILLYLTSHGFQPGWHDTVFLRQKWGTNQLTFHGRKLASWEFRIPTKLLQLELLGAVRPWTKKLSLQTNSKFARENQWFKFKWSFPFGAFQIPKNLGEKPHFFHPSNLKVFPFLPVKPVKRHQKKSGEP